MRTFDLFYMYFAGFAIVLWRCVMGATEATESTLISAADAAEQADELEDCITICVGQDGSAYIKPTYLKPPHTHEYAGPYRTPEQPTEVKPVTAFEKAIHHAEQNGGRAALANTYASLAIAEAIDKLTAAIKEKKNA